MSKIQRGGGTQRVAYVARRESMRAAAASRTGLEYHSYDSGVRRRFLLDRRETAPTGRDPFPWSWGLHRFWPSSSDGQQK